VCECGVVGGGGIVRSVLDRGTAVAGHDHRLMITPARVLGVEVYDNKQVASIMPRGDA